MKNVICIPFAWDETMKSSVNISSAVCESTGICFMKRGWRGGGGYATYLKNVCVACFSAKRNNPSDEVVFATNLMRDSLPAEMKRVLESESIKIMTIPFNEFRFDNNYTWGLAFYKLCVLKHLSEMEYSNICYLDADVYVQGNFHYIWKESEKKVLLYDINHGLQVEHYKEICEQFKEFLGKTEYLTHYGGEFFSATRDKAKRFIAECEKIFNEMQDKQFYTDKGDEFIVSIAANRMPGEIKNAGAYIYRFWTGLSFRLISSCYTRILALHLPAEKERGMVRVYNRYVRKGILPRSKKVWALCHITSCRLKTAFDIVASKILNR